MFQEMIRIAEAREEVLQLELEFVEGNDRARRLYEKMGFRITEIPIVFEDRHSGSSKMSASIIREAVWMVMKLPLRPVKRYHTSLRSPPTS